MSGRIPSLTLVSDKGQQHHPSPNRSILLCKRREENTLRCISSISQSNRRRRNTFHIQYLTIVQIYCVCHLLDPHQFYVTNIHIHIVCERLTLPYPIVNFFFFYFSFILFIFPFLVLHLSFSFFFCWVENVLFFLVRVYSIKGECPSGGRLVVDCTQLEKVRGVRVRGGSGGGLVSLGEGEFP